MICVIVFCFKQTTAYEMRISDWSSDVCSSDLLGAVAAAGLMLDMPLLAAAVAITVLSLGYDMTQPLFAGIVTSLGGQRPGQAMGLNVFALFTGLGIGAPNGRASDWERGCKYV